MTADEILALVEHVGCGDLDAMGQCEKCEAIRSELVRLATRACIKPGTWPQRCEQRAFVDGAKWWEFTSTDGTMWQSDQRKAEDEAVRRYGEPETET